jgi:hypothetical protein
MKRAGSIEPANILAAMSSTAYAGVTGLTQFDSHGDLNRSTISPYEYVDGKQKLLDVLKR